MKNNDEMLSQTERFSVWHKHKDDNREKKYEQGYYEKTEKRTWSS